MNAPIKPLGVKGYGHIPHLPGSRLGPGDHHCHEGQARICLEKTRDRYDYVTVTEKLDGSCCAVCKFEGKLYPLTRKGYDANTSNYLHHRLFAWWVNQHYGLFDKLLAEGERVVGEWLAMAHGTRYKLIKHPLSPFAPFDIFTPSNIRLPYEEVVERTTPLGFNLPFPILRFPNPLLPNKTNQETGVWDALVMLGFGFGNITFPVDKGVGWHGALDPVEGAVWRVERNGKFDFLAKYVRPEKEDGIYLPKISGKPPVWNWYPDGVNLLRDGEVIDPKDRSKILYGN